MDVIKFKVNGVEQTVQGSNVNSNVMLVDYLRNYLQLRGTKYMCREGGCGSCMVTTSKTPGAPRVAVNSCLISVASCHGWDIKTIEGLGNRKDGYHPLQKTMAENCASQCGYCTPGWIMTMHGLLESNKELTMLEMEKTLNSNICRCTGYRPILDAFKKFAKDAPKEDRIMNIKDMSLCKTSGNCCQSYVKEDGWCVVGQDDMKAEKMIKLELSDGKTWYRPTELSEVLKLMEENSESYMLVGGNTAKGAIPISDYPNALIDVSTLQELRINEYDQNLIVGAGLTVTEFMDVLEAGAKQDYFGYLSKIREHMELLAHVAIRNVGTIAGNLMVKHNVNVFGSDLYLLFDCVGAQLTIVDYKGVKEVVTMPYFLKMDMKGKVILNVLLPPLSDDYKLLTYKVMPRSQSSRVIISCAFLFKLNSCNQVVDSRIIYGALSVNFDRATATETYLLKKNLFTNETLQGALKVLDGEMIVDDRPPEVSVEYKRFLAKSLFFKALLTLCPNRGSRFESGIIELHKSRPVSSGKQTYTTDTSLWPLNKPMCKLESMIQCAGEAKYTEDIPSMQNEVFGAFVLSTVAVGTIIEIDPTEALALPGVYAFYTAKDIPGLNSYTPADGPFTMVNMEILSEGTISYYHQPIGIVVADSFYLADKASRLVTVKYSNVTAPVVDLKEAKKDSSRNTLFTSIDATKTGTDVYKTLSGTNVLKGQYHFPMETIVCVAKPTEEGLEVHMPTQWLDGPHIMISRALNMDQNKIDLHVNRIGGSYGYKITAGISCAIATSLVATKLNRPCRIIQTLPTNFRAFGKRMPSVNDYEVAVNKLGEIQYLNTTMYTDNGFKVNEPIVVYGMDTYYNCYDASKINYKSYNTVTNTAKNTFCRSPGTLEAIANIELIMERISYELSLDPLSVRLANLDKTKHGEIVNLVEQLKTSAEFTSRRAAVDSFNTQNRYKKRGLRWSFCRWPPANTMYDDVNIAVYHADGTVAIIHGGIEMGQGINTKIAQVAAHLLGIPLEMIQIKSNNTICSPNTSATGGSVAADNIIVALRKAIEQLLTRLEPVKTTLPEPWTWKQLISAAYAANVDLQAHGFVGNNEAQTYDIYGVACSEVEVDVLTGQYEVLRVDILQDVGLSISPDIDIGQIEGAFVMGMGYWTCERLVYDSAVGSLLTYRTWDYHVPQARDIPQDMRITFSNSVGKEYYLGSKGVGEPATCLASCVYYAIIEAIIQARQECKIPTTTWFDIDGPCSTENVCMAMKTKPEDFQFN